MPDLLHRRLHQVGQSCITPAPTPAPPPLTDCQRGCVRNLMRLPADPELQFPGDPEAVETVRGPMFRAYLACLLICLGFVQGFVYGIFLYV